LNSKIIHNITTTMFSKRCKQHLLPHILPFEMGNIIQLFFHFFIFFIFSNLVLILKFGCYFRDSLSFFGFINSDLYDLALMIEMSHILSTGLTLLYFTLIPN
jgi:hypothetical protein